LAALAIADIIFLSLLIPNFLANYDFFGFNYYFRVIYFNIKVHIIAFANWASAVALWYDYIKAILLIYIFPPHVQVRDCRLCRPTYRNQKSFLRPCGFLNTQNAPDFWLYSFLLRPFDTLSALCLQMQNWHFLQWNSGTKPLLVFKSLDNG
jgi:hypothetical protein